MEPLTDVTEVIARWRPLTTEERNVAETLLLDASDIIRVRFPDVDARLADGTLSSATIIRIVAGMVRRALMNRDSEGVTQGSETVGPFAHSQTYANPNGNLYMTADEIRALDVLGYAPKVRMGWLA